MDCNEAEDLLVPYLLGALEPRERSLIESHLGSCHECSLRLRGDGETVAKLALAVPQLEVPTRVRTRLMSRIDEDLAHASEVQIGSRLSQLWTPMLRALTAQKARAVASAAVVALVLGGVWFSYQLGQLSSDNQSLNEQIRAAMERDDHVVQMVKDQRDMIYDAMRASAVPGTSVNVLWGSGRSAKARGMMVALRGEWAATLYAINMPVLPRDRVYQVWLLRGDRMYGAGEFIVDSTGFGSAVIISVAPLTEFDAIRITVEPAGGSAGPTGTKVLAGDF